MIMIDEWMLMVGRGVRLEGRYDGELEGGHFCRVGWVIYTFGVVSEEEDNPSTMYTRIA